MASNQTFSIIIISDRFDDRFTTAVASAQFADQVVVINTNPDLKPTGAWKRKVRYHQWQPVDSFAQVRNRAIKEASTKWVFFLDSDEEISPKLAASIQTAITDDTLVGGLVHRTDYFHGQPVQFGEVGQAWKMRLGKVGKYSYSGAVHEVATAMGRTGYLKGELRHRAHQDISGFLQKVNRYAKLAAKTPRSVWRNLVEMLLFPPLKIMYTFLIRSGWRDGWRGFVYSYIMGLHSLSVRVYRYENSVDTSQK